MCCLIHIRKRRSGIFERSLRLKLGFKFDRFGKCPGQFSEVKSWTREHLRHDGEQPSTKIKLTK